MLHVTHTMLPSILAPDDGPVAEVINPSAASSICLVCEHASRYIPASLHRLGLDTHQQQSHAAWDIGALALTRALAGRLDAAAVVARVSRMVYDLNRAPEATDAIVARTEDTDIPGNCGLGDAERAQRYEELSPPFHDMVQAMLDRAPGVPVLVTIHSFTPVWKGVRRDVELGILHDSDDRLARAMLAAAPPGIDARLNEPYAPKDGVTHTLKLHALPRGILNVMIEVRNDLLGDDVAIQTWADRLATMLTRAMETEAAA